MYPASDLLQDFDRLYYVIERRQCRLNTTIFREHDCHIEGVEYTIDDVSWYWFSENRSVSLCESLVKWEHNLTNDLDSIDLKNTIEGFGNILVRRDQV